jgi:hypothetical protein
MANTVIQFKQSFINAAPISLNVGEPVYLTNTGYPTCATQLFSGPEYWIVYVNPTYYVVHTDLYGYIDSVETCP